MNRVWTSEVAKALCAEVGEPDPEVAIQSLVLQKLSGFGDGTFPVNLKEILEELGIDEVREEDCQGAGYLFDDGEDCWIGVNINDNERRRRFTVAHEIVHFLLPTHRHGTHTDGNTGSFSDYNEEEYLCDLGAAFMLIPQDKFVEMTEGKPVLPGRIWRIADRFDVSLEAAMVTTCKRINSKFLVSKWHRNDDGSMSLEKAYRSSQIANEFWIPPDTPVSVSHEIARVSEARKHSTCRSLFCLKQSNRKIYMYADYLALGWRGSPVLSVFRPKQGEKWEPL